MAVISEQPDSLLLEQVAEGQSPEAFAALVGRHSDWVYWAAVRMVGDPHLAEDVAQAVFLVLAQKAGKLRGVPLHRWLFKVTRYAAANAIRARIRRERHERRAAMEHSEIDQPDTDRMWGEISPVLEELIGRMRSADRDAILLRFYQQKELPEVAAALGVSEGAAKARIARAVEKLRGLLRRKGIAIPAAELGAAMAVNVTRSGPANIAARVASGTTSAKAAVIAKGVGTMTTLVQIKIVAMVILVLGIPLGTGTYLVMENGGTGAVQQHPGTGAAPVLPAAVAPELDPRVAPFVTSHTDILIEIDITKIDVDALAADLRGELGRSGLDAAGKARVGAVVQNVANAGKQWITAFSRAGGTSMFLAARADQLVSGGQGYSMKFTGETIVFPADSPAAAHRLLQFLSYGGPTQYAVIGSAVVENPPAWEPSLGSGARQALAAGLAAAADSPIRASVNPAKLKEVIPKLLASGDMGMVLKGGEWDEVESTSFRLVLPPAQSPGFVLESRFSDAAAAQRALKDAAQRVGNATARPSGPSKAIGEESVRMAKSETFRVDGNDLIGTMDLHAYWDVIFAAMNVATTQTAAQTQGPTN